MIQNGDGQIERMVEELTADMAEAAEVLSRRKISLAAALYLCNVVLLPQALYRLKLSHATSEQVDRVQAAVRRVVARKAKLTAAHSDVLFGGYMGCGWRRWRDEVGIERVKIIAMAWEEWDTTFARVMRGAVRRTDAGGARAGAPKIYIFGKQLFSPPRRAPGALVLILGMGGAQQARLVNIAPS